MPAKDLFHNLVKKALETDGWTIAADPLHHGLMRSLPWGGRCHSCRVGVGFLKFVQILDYNRETAERQKKG
ncbi:MAG: hypothetical protein GDA56_04890 [Hormoscilla sp. GM7CHS1pb]|nr:hypothetical protein [Hormoscilla sp. GM7CHS1pb]